MRKIIIVAIAIGLLIGSILWANQIVNSKKIKKSAQKTSVPTAYTQKATNEPIEIIITESGLLTAKRRAEIFSEVQGLMLPGDKDFKPGVSFKKNQTILRIDNQEFMASVHGQRSILQNQLTSMLPDLRLDFPQSFALWQAYLTDYNIHKTTLPLPELNSDKEKYFITSRGIYTSYYQIKNMEITARKHTILAPFDGIVTSSEINPGTVVRPGQKLGEFIDPSTLELRISLKQALAPMIKTGVSATCTLPGNPIRSWEAKVSRINAKVNPYTQTVDAFIELSGADLKDGMYMEAQLSGTHTVHAYEVDRSLLIQDKSLYIVTDSTLSLRPVTILYKKKSTVLVDGIDGTNLLVRPIPGAYDGMKVSIAPNHR